MTIAPPIGPGTEVTVPLRARAARWSGDSGHLHPPARGNIGRLPDNPDHRVDRGRVRPGNLDEHPRDQRRRVRHDPHGRDHEHRRILEQPRITAHPGSGSVLARRVGVADDLDLRLVDRVVRGTARVPRLSRLAFRGSVLPAELPDPRWRPRRIDRRVRLAHRRIRGRGGHDRAASQQAQVVRATDPPARRRHRCAGPSGHGLPDPRRRGDRPWRPFGAHLASTVSADTAAPIDGFRRRDGVGNRTDGFRRTAARAVHRRIRSGSRPARLGRDLGAVLLGGTS